MESNMVDIKDVTLPLLQEGLTTYLRYDVPEEKVVGLGIAGQAFQLGNKRRIRLLCEAIERVKQW